jgi:hypothetical protein
LQKEKEAKRNDLSFSRAREKKGGGLARLLRERLTLLFFAKRKGGEKK